MLRMLPILMPSAPVFPGSSGYDQWAYQKHTLVGIAGGIFECAFGKAGARAALIRRSISKLYITLRKPILLRPPCRSLQLPRCRDRLRSAEHMPADFMQWIDFNAGLTESTHHRVKAFFGSFGCGSRATPAYMDTLSHR